MQKQVAIITGGAQGIGKITAATLLRKDFIAVILDKDEEAGIIAEEELDRMGKATFLPCDISQEAEVKDAINKIVGAYGRIDILINNAGFGINKPVEELSLREWNTVIGTNLTGAFLCAKYCAPHLKKTAGSIVNICSTRAYMSEPNTEAYSASKGGLLALTHALAVSLGPEVRVNSISPGWINVTGFQKPESPKEYIPTPEDHAQHPAGRVGTPHDIANLVAFLVSDENGFITGQDFIADGGMTKKMIYV